MKHGVHIVGYTNLASMVAADASALYARNLLDFLKLIITKEGTLNIDLADDIVAATLLCRDGEVTRRHRHDRRDHGDGQSSTIPSST